MTNAIPFDEWLDEQGDNVRLAMCDGHPETLILVDTTTMYVYKYVPAENQDDARDMLREFLSKIGPSNAAREFVQHEVQDILDKPLDFKTTLASKFKAQDAQLQERIRHEVLMNRDIIDDERFIYRMRDLGIEVTDENGDGI